MLAPSLPDPSNQRTDLDSVSIPFIRSGPMLTHEEISPWTSLMAREVSLGPSDAPCLGETSTAHGDSPFSVSITHIKTVSVPKSSVPVTAHVLNLQSTNLLIPELDPSPQSLSQDPTNRRTHTEAWPTNEKLGFLLAGLELGFGPLTVQRLKPISSDPCLNNRKPRCDYFHIRSMPIFLIVQRSASVGRRLQPSRLDPSFIWLVRYHCQGVMRNLPKDLNLSKNFDNMQPICLSSSRTVSEWSRKISKGYAKVFPEEYIHRISLTAGDNLGPLLASFPVMVSRTHGNSFFWVEIIFIEKISRFESMRLFSTSQCLLIRTISHLPELFANVASTYLDLACDLGLFCSCLRVLVVLMSKYLSSMSCFLYAISLTMSSLVLAKTLSSVIFSSG